MMQRTGSGGFVDRLFGVARLDVPTYEAIEHDEGATTQALLVVVLVAIATGIGSIGNDTSGGLIGGIIWAILGWIVFSVVAYFVGSTLFATSRTSATIGQLLRTVGFAQAPKLALVVGFIPLFGWIVALVAWVWSLVTAIVAIRQALDFSTGRAIGTGLIATIANGIIIGVIGWIF